MIAARKFSGLHVDAGRCNSPSPSSASLRRTVDLDFWRTKLPRPPRTLGGSGPEMSKATAQTKLSRKKRRIDVDSMRGRVLYALAARGYAERHGCAPLPSDLNREFPASSRGARSSGAWNELKAGKHLPRQIHAPQGNLMTRLRELDPRAAASRDWPIWRLSSAEPLLLPEVHALMLQMRVGTRHIFIGSFVNGRVMRWPTDRLTEIEWMLRENSFDALTALIALIREAELLQDEGVFTLARGAAFLLLPVLAGEFCSAALAEEFSEFLHRRFAYMGHLFFGYEGPPTAASAIVVMPVEPGDGPREPATFLLESQWKGGK